MRSSEAAPAVAVVTVSYGSEESLLTFLSSVPLATTAAVDIVVADNLPTGDVSAIAARHGARYLPLPDNPGYGGAANAAAATLGPGIEWILIVNPDVVLGAGTLDAMVAVGQEDPTIGSVGPAILTPSGELYPSARRVPSLRIGVGHALFANAWPANPWTRRYRQDDEAFRRTAGWLSGSCVLVRRSAFEAISGFDEGFFMYFEDVDLGMRLGRAGWSNVYEPAIKVEHVGAHSTTTHRSAMIAAHHASANRFLQKKYPGARWAPVRLLLRAGLALRSFGSRIRARARAGS